MRWRRVDQRLERLTHVGIAALAACGVAIVGTIDYVTGYEFSIALFYLGPVALATWYSGRRAGIGFAVLCCIVWYIAEISAGAQYSYPATPLWNALVRLGFFLVTSFLLSALRETLRGQQYLARTDGLTELYSRRVFEERLRHDLALAQRGKNILSLAYLDLDDFKVVNDARGHAEGDQVLRTLGGVLRASVRETDTAARIGGDEFAIVFPDTDPSGAQEIVAKIRVAIQETLGAGASPVTCSIGVTTFMNPAISPESAIAAADALMFEAKRHGKGAVVFSVFNEAVKQPPGVDASQAARR